MWFLYDFSAVSVCCFHSLALGFDRGTQFSQTWEVSFELIKASLARLLSF